MVRELSFGELVFVLILVAFARFGGEERGSDHCNPERKRQNNRYVTNKL